MNSAGLSAKDSPIHSVDPRARLAACAIFIALAALAGSWQQLAALLALACGLVALAHIKPSEIAQRVILLNLFAAMLCATMPGREGMLALWGGLQEGAGARMLELVLRCNAMLLGATALAGSIETSAFGHALAHFGAPDKLTHLFLFTVSQTETLSREQERLRDAMRARAFRPKSDLRSCKSLAELAAMTLARSLERAERLSESMRCRNFKGRFHLFHHFKMKASDWAFAVASLIIGAGFATWEALLWSR